MSAEEEDYPYWHPEGTFWKIDGPDIITGEQPSYEQTFINLLREQGFDSFEDLLRHDKAAGIPAEVLDLFGGGFFIEDQEIVDGMVAARLKDLDKYMLFVNEQAAEGTRYEPAKRGYRKKIDLIKKYRDWDKRTVVEGDLYDDSTWQKIKETKQYQAHEGFSLVICRPWGAFEDTDEVTPENITTFMGKYFKLLSNAYSVTGNRGSIYTQIPLSVQDREEYLYLEHSLRNTPGISASGRVTEAPYAGRILRITKTDSAPRTLLRPLAKSMRR